MKSQALEMNCLVPEMKFCFFIKQQKGLPLSGTLTLLLYKKSLRRCELSLSGGEKQHQNMRKKSLVFRTVFSFDVSSVRISRERKTFI